MTQTKETILIVDDGEINRIGLRAILEPQYEVLEAQNGAEALDILTQGKKIISAVLLDIMMPVMTGYDFLKNIRARDEFALLPIIVMTGSESSKSELAALQLGANDFVFKPYEPTILKQRLSNFLEFRRNAIYKYDAEHDFLTGLYNQKTFYTKVFDLISMSGAPSEFEIFCLNIEQFKIINDLFGNREGDRFLKFIAEELKGGLRGRQAIVARIFADQFFICGQIRENLLDTLIKIPPKVGVFSLKMDISIKIGIYQVDGLKTPVNVMCDRAKLAINKIKGKYKEPFAYYEKEDRELLIQEQQIINSMQNSLERREFSVFFQPKFHISGKKILGAEALVRWFHPQLGMIPPSRFIPIFEKNGFIFEMDNFVWTEVCIFLRKLLDNNKHVVPLSINISRVDLYNPELCRDLCNLVKKYNLDKKFIHLEITESAYVKKEIHLIETVKKLRDAGFVIEMDDFGSGFSSLNMLSELPADILKIDLMFMKNIENSKKGANILSSVVHMAKSIDMETIIEGVENNNQLSILQRIGCDTVQGFVFSKPVPMDEFETMLAAS